MTRAVALGSAILLPFALVPFVTASAAVAPVGNGFTVTAGDLGFILKQIKIAERHSMSIDGTYPGVPANPNPTGDPVYCQSMIGRAADQIPDYLTSYGLRTVDGSCNNLKVGSTASVLDSKFAAADQLFPRLTTPVFRDAEPITAAFPVGSPRATSYAQKTGVVIDSQPRVISNLIVDQTSTNPAAVDAALHPVRTQGAGASAIVCTTDPQPTALPPVAAVPVGCTPTNQTLFIPNVTTDVGLSPPYNSLFTFFGQFFDHGVDQTVKSGATVFVPLQADDPLTARVPANQRFMVLTRAQNQPGPDGILGTADDVQNATNTDTPWVDQSQTYTSHASHQVFLREYVNTAAGRPVATGRLLGGLAAGQTYLGSPDGTHGISTWAAVKLQSAQLLGLQLVDRDVTNIPMLATDPYGKFIPGPNGLPQYVTTTGLVEGNIASPVPVPANAIHFDTPFLTDIAHNADPSPQTDPATGAVTIPVPDADLTPSADFAAQPAGTYDDEMLNAHFVCGDGRCNENIALSTIHQVFHSEHDRLVDYIKNVLTTDTSPTGVLALSAWQPGAGAATPNGGAATPDGWNGERLFQAARFVTEMEYQHLVFEEFARKMQPGVRPFHVYSPDINPAVKAEFAHAVYRFGHSMLDDTVARTNEAPDGTKTDNSLPLLKAFLNPPEFYNSGSATPYTPEQAAGAVVMGSSDQIGNELDEFVVETLRNNLLGLPLDLATLNMTRARDAGIPPLNDVRRQIHAQTNDAQLAPYTSWADFGQNMKHPLSLVNFVAAYGTHPTITAATTLAAKREAARLIVNPNPFSASDTANRPADADAFLFGSGTWVNTADGHVTTGLEGVDLWVGGLAEITNLFGGLLGSTFNYVFQSQLENLQDGDRLYYLARTPGLNLRTQLEGNSFAEIIQRNTDGTHSLKADAFATADCRFELSHLNGTPAGYAASGSIVADDPTTTDCNEQALLLRKPDGTIQYRQVNSVNPVGINGQSVYNGTSGADRIWGGNDNDTFWGGAGNDVIEGNGGDDVALGGDGNDIITDLSGADVLKGGPGNDAIDAGLGNDIIMGGDGQDFLNGGANDNETFAGPGNDFVIAGQGADAVFGDGGDDWIEGGTGQDLLQGDHGAPFFDDPGEPAPGNDIMVGQIGENDYDAEGGDDVMAQNAAVDRNAGAGGFDWAIHQYNTVAADDDMMINNNLGGLPIQVIVNRDRWQETEADSGGTFNDVIKGTDGVLATPRLITGGGFTGCDAIDQAGLDRITGLAALLPPVASWTGDAGQVALLSASGRCPLVGKVWGEGDILLGGGGSDTITGRAGNEIIDGDRELRVAISVRTNPADATTEIGRTDLMEGTASSGSFGPGTAGMTLQQAVFAGLVDPGNLVGVREIVTPTTPVADCGAATPLNCDTAVFLGPLSRYTITAGPDGTLTVADNTSPAPAPGVVAVGDGTDTLRNIEQLRFSDQTVAVVLPAAPTAVTAVAGAASATVSWTFPSTTNPPTDGFEIVATPASGTPTTITGISRTARSRVVAGLVAGTSYTFAVRAVNMFGTGPLSVSSNAVTPTAPLLPPAAPTAVTAVAGVASATVSWTAPVANGGPPITSYELVTSPATIGPITGLSPSSTSTVVTGLTAGTSYTFTVQAVNADGTGPLSAASNAVVPTALVAPTAPTGLTAVRGNTVVSLSWTDGAGLITGHIVQVRIAGVVVRTDTITGAGSSTVIAALSNGTGYTFRIRAVNAAGQSALSAASNRVTPATLPGAPVIGIATQGPAGGALTAVAAWSAPLDNGGAAIVSYRVTAQLMAADGVTVVSSTSQTVGAAARTRSFALAAGSYQFVVVATNAVGDSVASAASNLVTPR